MVGFPGLENAGGLTTQQYVQAIYNLAISVGALLAVIQIIFAGVEYMFSDVVTSKSAAIKRIRGSLLGLLIIISAVLLLQTINPDLLNLDIFKNAPSIDTIQTSSTEKYTPAKIGDKVDTMSTDAVKNLVDTCSKSGGVVGATGSGSGRSGGKTTYGCYASYTTISAKPGEIFNTSSYAPAEEEQALNRFKDTCSKNGGIIGGFTSTKCNVIPDTSSAIDESINIPTP
jgi:hypothetical protein